jgi:hypothetical protein
LERYNLPLQTTHRRTLSKISIQNIVHFIIISATVSL